MGATEGEEVGPLLDEQRAYYRALAADYLNQGLDLPGGDEVTEALERTFRNRRVGMPASARILHGHQPYGLHLGPGWNLPAAGLLVCLI